MDLYSKVTTESPVSGVVRMGVPGYTPVRGVDYWTEEDKAEIIAAVLAAIGDNPGGGSSGDESAAAYTVSFGDESNYTTEIGHEERFYGLKVDDKIPTLKQMENCSIECYFDGEMYLPMSDAEVVDAYGDGRVYLIYFRYGSESVLNQDGPHFIVNTDPTYTCGVGLFAVYETFEESYSRVYEASASMYAATLTFPEV